MDFAMDVDPTLYIFQPSDILESERRSPPEKERVTQDELADFREPVDFTDWQGAFNHVQRKIRTLEKLCGKHVPCFGFYNFEPRGRYLEWDECVRLSEILPTPATLERLNTGDPAPLYYLPLIREVLRRPHYYQGVMLRDFAILITSLYNNSAKEYSDLNLERFNVDSTNRISRSSEIVGLISTISRSASNMAVNFSNFESLLSKTEPLMQACVYLFSYQGPLRMGYARSLFLLYSYFEMMVGSAFEDLKEAMEDYRRIMEIIQQLRTLLDGDAQHM